MTQFQRIAFCTSLAVINAPHVSFWCETQHNSAEPYQKLQTKLLAWLRGELKSEANLLRFHDAFCEWRDAQPEDDSLAWRLLQFCCAALHSACETLFDPECDDTELLLGSLEALWAEMDELGAETSDLRQYWHSLQQELPDLIKDNTRLPFPKAWFVWLQEADVSLFGLSND